MWSGWDSSWSTLSPVLIMWMKATWCVKMIFHQVRFVSQPRDIHYMTCLTNVGGTDTILLPQPRVLIQRASSGCAISCYSFFLKSSTRRPFEQMSEWANQCLMYFNVPAETWTESVHHVLVPHQSAESFIQRPGQWLVPALPPAPPSRLHLETWPRPAHAVPVKSQPAEQLQRGGAPSNTRR